MATLMNDSRSYGSNIDHVIYVPLVYHSPSFQMPSSGPHKAPHRCYFHQHVYLAQILESGNIWRTASLLLEGRVCSRGEEDVKTRRQAGVERADSVVGMRADPSYVKLMTALQDLAQLLGQLLEGQGDAVLASSRKGWAC